MQGIRKLPGGICFPAGCFQRKLVDRRKTKARSTYGAKLTRLSIGSTQVNRSTCQLTDAFERICQDLVRTAGSLFLFFFLGALSPRKEVENIL